MIAEQLRKSILQAAIQGKLTEQLPEDGYAGDLLNEIQKEKARLVKEGRIKQEKSLPEVTEDEIPFEIPGNWCWVRLINACLEISDVDHKMPSAVDNGIPYVSPLNFYGRNEIDYNNAKKIGYEDFKNLSNKSCPEYGDIIFPRYGTIGVVRLVETTDQFIVSYSCALIKMLPGIMNSKYFFYLLQSPHVKNEIERYINKTTQPNIGLASIKQFVIPAPPIEEQNRIVEGVESILSHLDSLEKDELKLKALQESFPKKMKDSILQYAIQGKLTEQLESDGDAYDLLMEIQKEKKRLVKEGKIKKEKTLPVITEDEIPFEIPENWCWVRLAEISSSISAGGDKPERFSKTRTENFKIPVISNGKLNNGIFGYTDSAVINETSITISGRGTIGYSCVREYPYHPIVRLITVIPILLINPYYLEAVFTSLLEIGVGTSIQQLTVPMVSPKLVPLPPLSEQNRIVERLNQLLPLCDALE